MFYQELFCMSEQHQREVRPTGNYKQNIESYSVTCPDFGLDAALFGRGDNKGNISSSPLRPRSACRKNLI